MKENIDKWSNFKERKIEVVDKYIAAKRKCFSLKSLLIIIAAK